MPTPIFVVGAARTGTTWVANILCRHQNIAGIQAAHHMGIHESAFFWVLYERFGTLENEENYKKLVDIFTKTDYFKISNFDEDLFLKNPKPNTYHEFFRRFMDEFAKANSCDYWVEKTPAHTLYIKQLAEFYPDAIFVSIERDIVDKVKSRLKQLENRSKLKSRLRRILKDIFTYRMMKVHLNELPNLPNKSFMLNFEDLKNNTSDETQRLFNFLDLEFSEHLLENKYRPNTSFSSEAQRKSMLSDGEKKFIRKMHRFASFIPSIFYKSIAKLYLSRCKYVDPPDWFWRKDRS